MKKSEIEIGKMYSTGHGRVRKIVDIGPQYKIYEGQCCTENLCYEIIQDGTKKNSTVGKRCCMTVAAFASWAKRNVGIICGQPNQNHT